MHSTFVGALALVALVSAVPVEKRNVVWLGNHRGGNIQGDAAPSGAPANGYYTPSASAAWNAPSQTAGSPPPSASYGSGAATSDGSTSVFKFPLSNGFPVIANPSSQLTAIEQQAHGTLPNAPPPAVAPQPDDLTSLRLIAFNELWEVAYFTEFLYNVTNNVQGYQFQDQNQRSSVIAALTAIVAQEELHALNANGALAHFNAGPIQPCTYKSPVSNFHDAVALAKTFTAVVIGTLGDVQTHFGTNGDNGLIRGVAAVIGQEGEQAGYYRNLLGEIPSETAFMTASTRELAFSAVTNSFVVPGSCPNANTIALPVFTPLNLLTANVQALDQQLQYSYSATGQNAQYANGQGLSLVLINQQNVPVVVPMTNVQSNNGVTTFQANFPFQEKLMHGLTIGCVSKGTTFATITDVVANAVAGPALITVD